MRRILWTLAICSAIGASASLAVSQDRYPFSDPSPFPSGTATRSESFGGRMTAGQQPNYSELFNSGTSSDSRRYSLNRTASASNTVAADSFRSSSAERLGSTARDFPTQSTYRPVGFDSDTRQQRVEDVIHAEYQRRPGDRERIERIGLTGREPLPSPATDSRYETEVSRTSDSRRTSRFTITRDTRLTDPISTSPSNEGEATWNLGSRLGNNSQPARPTQNFVPSRSEQPQTPVVDFSQQGTRGHGNLTTTPQRPAATTTASAPVTIKLQEKDAQTPSVTLEWVKKTGINVGQQCTCDLIVKNTGIIPAEQVEVSASFPTTVRVVTTSPQPASAEDVLRWEFTTLAPGEEQVIEIHMIPLERGDLATSANVRFTGTTSTKFTVSEPLLQVALKGPEKVMVGEPASHTVVVTNPGTGVATNVQVEAIIPKGLEHARNDRLIMDLGSLNPGESRSVRLALAAIAGGKHVVQVQARADGDLSQNTSADVDVIAPILVAEIDGPGLRYLGRNATYTLRVRNDGVVTTENVRVMHKVPEGFTLVESDRGAQFDAPNSLLNWFVGRLGAGQTAELNVTLRSDRIGSFTQFMRATSEHGAVSDAQVTTQVEGVSSLAMEIKDLDDPVEVGNETAYEIVVKNEGSAPASNVSLACEMASSLTVLKAQGPVESFTQPGGVSFRPVIELAPGNSVTYRIHVRGTSSGQHRIRARLSSDSVSEPITEDELTRFYGE